MTTEADRELRRLLESRETELRPPGLVMSPGVIGAARLTRYSFSRTMLRRAVAENWSARRVRLDLDAEGRGEAIYEVVAGDHRFSFIAFTTTLDEAEHTDRVIADRWEISGALVEGGLTDDLLQTCRTQIPLQEEGRLDSRVLVLTRGNRSVRFFQYLVDTLAGGDQPDPELVADAGYIMRSTAFYGNGKWGMRSFEGYGVDHPLRVPYRAQFVCAWLYRELSYDVVEHCARQQGGQSAVGFGEEWRRYFGLGNATGLGLVPYALKHPRVLNAWAGVRELALADVRAMSPTDDEIARFEWWLDRAHRHFSEGTSDDCEPFLNARELAPIVGRIRAGWELVRAEPRPFDALYRWAETLTETWPEGRVVEHAEATELVVSFLLELHRGDDVAADRLLLVAEHESVDPTLTALDLRTRLGDQFGWLADLELDRPEADAFWWVISDNTEEPRRVARSGLAPEGRNAAIDVALSMWRLSATLDEIAPDLMVHELLARHPEHRMAVERLLVSDGPYGELRDNVCDGEYLPLLIQRFQLAMYGMDNFKPKSTDWLRVTLFQGAPRLADLNHSSGDDWVLPPRPSAATAAAAKEVT